MIRILFKRRYISLIISIFVFLFFSANPHYGQTVRKSGSTATAKKSNLKQDTIVVKKRVMAVHGEEPDTNFTYEKYAAFLKAVSDTSRFTVLPLNDFRKTLDSHKIIIGLRHDVDIDLNLAYQFSETESKLGFRSTYFILHTAPYYLEIAGNMAKHTDKILPILRDMQDNRHLEIGWHNDLVTLQAVYNIDPVTFLHSELNWLRSNGIRIHGTASHGSNYCYTYKYLNYYFFEEFTYPVVGQFINNVTLPIGNTPVQMKKGRLSDFNLEYEAYFINNNKYFSDASVINGKRWYIGMLDINQLHPGDRVIILTHPVHWHKASVNAEIESFHVDGQISSTIDVQHSTINVLMPPLTNRSFLSPRFILSPGAYVKVNNRLQVNGYSSNDFSTPVKYVVYAENRDIKREWTVNISCEKNSACNFESFSIAGLTNTVKINSVEKTILVEVNEVADLENLQVQFELSPGATAWIGNTEQISNTGTVNFSKNVEYKVIAEDGIRSCKWIVAVKRETIGVQDIDSSHKNLSIYPNPSGGLFHLYFKDITEASTKVTIFNARGERVFSDVISKTGSFTVDANLSKLPSGYYILKFSESEKPIKLLIRK